MRTAASRRSRFTRRCRSFAAIAVASLGVLAGHGVAGALTTTALTGQASASGYPAGVAIFDSATLGLGTNPTGNITFTLFGPGDTTCGGTPLFTTSVTVTGNGYYQSASFTTASAGTYRWVAAYSGDAGNTPSSTSCSDSAQHVQVAKKTPTLNSTASKVDGLLVDTATLDKGAGAAGPTGTITFLLYGPNDLVCGNPPAFTSTKAVSGNGVYTSDSFRPRQVGTYQWVSRYSGDADNHATMTICSDPLQSVSVDVLPPLPSLSVVSAPPPSAMRDHPYEHWFRATGPDGVTLTFSLESGTLPPGLSLEPSGRLLGTPTETGRFGPITVKVSGVDVLPATQAFDLVVNLAPEAVGFVWSADGRTSLSGPSGTQIWAYGTGLAPNRQYKLVTGRDGGEADHPCGYDVVAVNDAIRTPTSTGFMGYVGGAVNRPPGTWQVCFYEVTTGFQGRSATMPFTFTVTG